MNQEIHNIKYITLLIAIGFLTLMSEGYTQSPVTEMSFIAKNLEWKGIAIQEDNYTVWGCAPIQDDEGKTHLFAARWPEKNVDPAWRKSSEIAHYVSDHPEGPFTFSDVAITGTGKNTWDKYAPHNPEIKKVGDTYVLLYIGNTDYHQPPHPSNQSIGMAIAKSPYGPWKKVGKNGQILNAKNPTKWNYQSRNGAVNPTLLVHRGKYYLYFKSSGKNGLRYGLAIANQLEGPYEITDQPVTTNRGTLEDGTVFNYQDHIYLLTTDNHGQNTGIRGGGTLWKSKDGITFNLEDAQIGYDRIPAYYRDYDPEKVVKIYGADPKLERPKILMIKGKPAYLYAPGGWNVTGGERTVCHVLKINDPDEFVASDHLNLWYAHPATDWMQEALPIGNGFLGAMFFGGIEEERIQFNEESLWSGGKGEWNEYNGGNRPGAYKHLPKVRQLLGEGKYEEAHALANKELTGIIKENQGGKWVGFGAYQSFGDLYIRPRQQGESSNYSRQLDIGKSLGVVKYKIGDINHQRTYFASYPKRALIFHLKNDAENGIDYEIELTSLHANKKIWLENNVLIMKGALENNGMEFESRLYIDSDDANFTFINNKLTIYSARTLTLYLTAATDYVNQYPHYTGRDYERLNQNTITQIKSNTYHQIRKEHIKDYQSLFHRVQLELGKSPINPLPTDQRLLKYQEGNADPALEALYFQYGRYLLISSSRPGSLPANLQGKWNHLSKPPWASDYHANINIQMIYWPAEITNIPEVHKPLIDYIDRLRAPGRQTAKDFFNAKGWIVNTMNNVFGFTAPGWSFPWGFFPAGAAWYGQHAWQHYEFNPDEEYLAQTAYPILKEAAEFWLDYLTEDEDGYLVSSPSYSPEHGGISTGAYMDIEIVWELFNNTIKALNILGNDREFRLKLEHARDQLLPLKVGRWGQLQEWKEDVDDPKNKHRHLSHLFALHPGNQISVLKTPELAEAAKTSLIARGNEGTGWSIGWKINFWARLQNAENAYAMLRRAKKISGNKGYNMVDGGGIYPNMFSTHPPFQLDGNMGATSGIAEMLLQSHAGTIELLPALPNAWPEGHISGLKARNGIEVDIKWSGGQLIEAIVKPTLKGTVTLKYKNLQKIIEVTDSGTKFNWDGK